MSSTQLLAELDSFREGIQSLHKAIYEEADSDLPKRKVIPVAQTAPAGAVSLLFLLFCSFWRFILARFLLLRFWWLVDAPSSRPSTAETPSLSRAPSLLAEGAWKQLHESLREETMEEYGDLDPTAVHREIPPPPADWKLLFPGVFAGSSSFLLHFPRLFVCASTLSRLEMDADCSEKECIVFGALNQLFSTFILL